MVAIASPFIGYEMTGVREFNGRYASLKHGGVRVIMEARGQALAGTLAEIYRREAPRDNDLKLRMENRARTKRHFADDIRGDAAASSEGLTVAVRVSPEMEKLREWISEGTTRHPIVATGPLLRFHWPAVGHVVWRRSVTHPGTKPNPWEQRALVPALALAENETKRMARNILRVLSTGGSGE